MTSNFFFGFFDRGKKIFFLFIFLFSFASEGLKSPRVDISYKSSFYDFGDIRFEVFSGLTRKKVELFQFLDSLSHYDVLLLGERHDQKIHHDFRAFLIEKINEKRERKKVIGFEHIQKKDQSILNEFKEKRKGEAFRYVDELARKLNWKKTWGDWSLFRFLFEKTYKLEAQVLGLNLSFEKMKQIVRKGKEALEYDFIKKTGLDKELSE